MKAATHLRNLSYDAWEATRDETYGPLPVNPFTTLRKRLDLSHQRLAEHMQISKLSLIRLEQGIYPDPLPTALWFWVNQQGENELHLTDSYYEFQNLTRQHYFKLFGDSLSIDVALNIHPLSQLRRKGDGQYGDLSAMQVSKFLCVAQSTLQHFEQKWRIQKSTPKTLAHALNCAGYSAQEVNEFGEQYEDWRSCRKLHSVGGRDG